MNSKKKKKVPAIVVVRGPVSLLLGHGEYRFRKERRGRERARKCVRARRRAK